MSFAIWTGVEIDFHCRHIQQQDDYSYFQTADGTIVDLPPYSGSGYVYDIRTDNYTQWSGSRRAGTPVLPRIPYSTGDIIYTEHTLSVSNSVTGRVEDHLFDPCLANAPAIGETLQPLGATPTFSSISVTISNPSYKILFSSDFVISNSAVRVYRFVEVDGQRTKHLVWVGFCTGVTFDDKGSTTIAARPNIKKLDRPATFGFEDEIPKWKPNNFAIPIVCCRLVPFSAITVKHLPQRVPYYDNFLSDYQALLPEHYAKDAMLTADQQTKLDIAKTWSQFHNPTYVSFALEDLVPGFLQMEASGSLTFNRGIFIGKDAQSFRASAENFTLGTRPSTLTGTHRIPIDNLDRMEFAAELGLFPINIGSSYSHWTTWDSTQSGDRATDDLALKVRPSFSFDGEAQPLDGLHTSYNNQFYLWAFIHQIDRFLYPMGLSPSEYIFSFWAQYLIHSTFDQKEFEQIKATVASGLQTFRSLPRCKDMYVTLPEISAFSSMSDDYAEELRRYSAQDTLIVGSKYESSAAQMLRPMPAHEDSPLYESEIIPAISTPHAFLCKGVYDPPNKANYFDIDVGFNPTAHSGFLQNQYFKSYYHHDRRGTSNSPSYFVAAVLEAAGLPITFDPEGSGIDGPLNDYSMQLISDTSKTYASLLTRVLPALGYIGVMDYEAGVAGGIRLVDMVPVGKPKYTLTSESFELTQMNWTSNSQRTNIEFENPDMTRGINTLDGVDDPEEQGRLFVYGDSPFLFAPTTKVEYGTWTCRYQDVADVLSSRQDRYEVRIPAEVYYAKEMNVLIGDWIALVSQDVPTISDSITVQVHGRNLSEDFITLTCFHRSDLT